MGLFSGLKKGVSSILGHVTGQKAGKAIDKSTGQQMAMFNRILELNQPFVDASRAQLAPLAEGASVGGYGADIGEILGGDAFQQLRTQRQNTAMQQLAQSGLRRAGIAGSAAADIDTDLAMQIESELNRRRQAIAGLGQGAMASSAGTLGSMGATQAAGTLGKAEAKAGGSENLMKIGGSLIGSIFSDARLKSNVKPVGKIGPLTVYSWDWNDAAAEMGLEGSSEGFLAHQVLETHPHRVWEEGGVLKIDHDGLIEDLKRAYH